MKKALHSSLVVVMLANGNIQNAFGMKLDKAESPAPSTGTVAPSNQVVTSPTEKELAQLYMRIAYNTNFSPIGAYGFQQCLQQNLRDVTKKELTQLDATMGQLRIACETNLSSLEAYGFLQCLKQNLKDVYAKLSPDQRAIFIKLHEKAAEASSETWDAVEKYFIW